MRKTILAERYAKALASAAKKRDALEAAGEDLRLLARGTTLTKADIRFWKNPMIDKAKKIELFKRLAQILEMEDVLLRFLCMLVKKNRLWLIGPVEGQYREIVDGLLGREALTVSTPYALGDEQKMRLAKAMEAKTGRKVHLIERVDASLVGGIRIKYGNSVIDGTVGAHLRMIARAAVGD